MQGARFGAAQLLSAGQTVAFYTLGLEAQSWVRKSYLRENKCFTDVWQRFVLLLKGWGEMDGEQLFVFNSVQTSMAGFSICL